MIRRRFINKVGEVKELPYLTIEALEDGLTASLSTNACQYSTDGVAWTDLAAGTTTPAINTGENLYFKATGLTPTSSAGIGTFIVSKQFNLSGNCMSMLFGDEVESNLDLTGKNRAFYKMFYNCKTLKSISDGFLPATTLADYCYSDMFYNCNRLTTAPELPATTLSIYCYSNMFYGCTGLTTAPYLPATTLADYCYYRMFMKCSKLNYIKAMFTTTPNSFYTSNWVSGVASTGTFVKNADATWDVTGVDGVPSGWTITTETEPVMIEFTIGGTSYQAEEGMTWGEWVESEYNIIDAQATPDDRIYIISNMLMINGTYVELSDVIESNTNYYVSGVN